MSANVPLQTILLVEDDTSDVMLFRRAYDLGINSYRVKPVAFDNPMQLVKMLGQYWMALNENPELVQEGSV
ncbi:MAG: hypothetical protein ACYC05_03860 [Sulfuricella sp.]|nr:hypothetical protein [Gammaproteobacteria bacterium]